jgi:hypothetical protein
MKMKDCNVKDGNLRWGGAYCCLLSVVTVAAVLIIAAPASAKSGFSFNVFFSDGYYEDARMRYKHGTQIYEEHDRGWARFYDVPRRHDYARRHIHKPWFKHRHKIGYLRKHKPWRKHRYDFDHRKHKNFNRW